MQKKISNLKTIETALVVGAGIMGHAFAQFLAMNNIGVYLVDQTVEILDRARGWIEDNLHFMIELGELKTPEVEAALSRIDFTTDLAGNLSKADYVLEAVSENFELKRSIWEIIGQKAAPGAILASNTSSYDINELAEGVPNPQRVIRTHWFHPPQITPCVEVIPSKQAGQSCIDLIMEFLIGVYQYLQEKLGKTYFKPPKLLAKQVEAGRLGLKSSGGFYDYGPGAADAMRRERDRKFYARLELFRREGEQEAGL